MTDKYNIVYVLANEGMPNLIKIGKTQRKDLNARMSELYSTGVPFPFQCLWAGEVKDCTTIEQIIHNAFRDKRVNPKREFFNVAPDQVIPLLKEFSTSEITNTVQDALFRNISDAEKSAAKQFHRPQFNFEEMGIPVGSELFYVKDPDIKISVIGPKKVLYNAKEYALSALTKELLDLPYYVQPGQYWTYNNKNLRDIYDETYPYPESND